MPPPASRTPPKDIGISHRTAFIILATTLFVVFVLFTPLLACWFAARRRRGSTSEEGKSRSGHCWKKWLSLNEKQELPDDRPSSQQYLYEGDATMPVSNTAEPLEPPEEAHLPEIVEDPLDPDDVEEMMAGFLKPKQQ